MKKIASIIIAALMAATMSMAAMADETVVTVYPEDGKYTEFDGETADKDVSVGFAYEDEGKVIEIEDWELEDGYAVDITWSDLSFLYVIEGEDSEVTTRYVSRWDPDQLMWVIIDTATEDPVIGPLEGAYDESELFGVAEVDTRTVTSTAEAVTDKDLGVNGFAVTNRSSQGISVAYNYNQIKPLYDDPGDALAAEGATIPAVYGQLGGHNESEATLSTSYNYLNIPDRPPAAPGVCGTVTITIG